MNGASTIALPSALIVLLIKRDPEERQQHGRECFLLRQFASLGLENDRAFGMALTPALSGADAPCAPLKPEQALRIAMRNALPVSPRYRQML